MFLHLHFIGLIMKPWIKQQWVDALRSGNYLQGRGELVSCDNEYCCLGVLTDLYAIEHGLEFTVNTEHLKNQANNDMLSREVMRWAGLDECNPSISSSDVDYEAYNNPTSLAELNDAGAGFNRIADYIETQL
jgi:hypothetical protein